MRAFTIYVDRDVPVECANDRAAAELARRVHEAIDNLIEELAPGQLTHEPHEYARTTCQRGINNKYVYDEERQSDDGNV